MSSFRAQPLSIKAVFVKGRGTIGENRQAELDIEEWQDLRSQINRAKDHDIAVCHACLEPVVVHAKTSLTRRPHFQHRAGENVCCPWRTEPTRSIDRVKASIFNGLQEGPLHEHMCAQIAEVVKQDHRLVAGSVNIDTYVRPKEEGHGRWPDVQFELRGRGRFAIEVQFAPSLAPEVVGRSEFYLRQGMHLIWILPRYDFEVSRRAFADDIAYEGHGTAFCLDDEALAQSRLKGTLVLRALWREGGEVRAELVTLDDLTYAPSSHPYFVDTVTKGVVKAAQCEREKIVTLLRSTKGMYHELPAFQPSAPAPDFREERFVRVVFSSWMHARGEFENFLNKQPNISALLNPYLSSEDGKRYANFLDLFLRRSAAGHDLKPKVWEKIELSRSEPQLGMSDHWYSFAVSLFPEVFREDLRARMPPPDWAKPAVSGVL